MWCVCIKCFKFISVFGCEFLPLIFHRDDFFICLMLHKCLFCQRELFQLFCQFRIVGYQLMKLIIGVLLGMFLHRKQDMHIVLLFHYMYRFAVLLTL